MWAFISSSSSISVLILSLCIHWPSLLIVIISMSSNVVSGKKRWGAVGWWVKMDEVDAGTTPERSENNPDGSYLTWQLWQRIISLQLLWVSERVAKGERKESGKEGRESEGWKAVGVYRSKTKSGSWLKSMIKRAPKLIQRHTNLFAFDYKTSNRNK